jgi:hypothetical protein
MKKKLAMAAALLPNPDGRLKPSTYERVAMR